MRAGDDLAADRIVGVASPERRRPDPAARPAAGARRDRRRSPCRRPRARSAARRGAAGRAPGRPGTPPRAASPPHEVERLARMGGCRSCAAQPPRPTARPDGASTTASGGRRRRSPRSAPARPRRWPGSASRSRSWKAAALGLEPRLGPRAAPAPAPGPPPTGRSRIRVRSGRVVAQHLRAPAPRSAPPARRRRALVGAGGIGEAVADHPGAARQGRARSPARCGRGARRTSAASR